MNILFFGPNGSGKGTQGAILKEKYNLPHIESGAIFRDNISKGTELGAQAKAYIDRWYSFKDAQRISELKGDKKVIGVYAQGAKDGTYHRLFESNERLFNSNNFAYLGTLVTPDYKIPQEGDDLLQRAFSMGLTL